MTAPDLEPPSDEPIGVVDLFSGCGGFSAGFRAFRPGGKPSPFRAVAAVENDPAAAATYAMNFGASHVHCQDIADFDPGPYSDRVEVIMGGPPCQGFSGLGRRDAEDPRNLLWREYVRVVRAVRPKVFVLENVDRFGRSAQFADLEAATTKPDGPLRDYRLRVELLNAADYGVPQARRRVIVIATHRDLLPLRHPEPTHARNAPPPATEAPATLFEHQEGKRRPRPWRSVGRDVFSRSAQRTITAVQLPEDRVCAPLGTELPGAYRTTELHVGRTPTRLSVERYKAIPAGGNRKDLRGRTATIEGVTVGLSTPSWDRHNSGSGDVMGRLHADRPSVTIRTEFYKPEKGRYLHPVENRPLTHYEAALIQGFPDDYRWCGSKIQIARQIGNAVPVGLGRAVAEAVHRHLRG